ARLPFLSRFAPSQWPAFGRPLRPGECSNLILVASLLGAAAPWTPFPWTGARYARRKHERSLPARVPASAGRADARVVHAPGRPLTEGVSCAPRAVRDPRDLQDARTRRGGDAAAGGTARRGRGDPVLRHRGAGRRDR